MRERLCLRDGLAIRCAIRIACAAPLILSNSLAVAADPPEPSAAGSSVQEITVTARRRAENIDDVPISIAAVQGDQLATRQIDSTKDLNQVVPNLQFSPVAPSSGNSSSSAIFIRGVGQTDFIASTDPGVGFYVDGVYFARASGTAVSLLDVEHVEVLRGPQGTLFGRNTVGGAIQVISHKPVLSEFTGRVGAALGRFSRRDIDAAINLPLGDTFAIRLAATRRDRNGYVTRISDGLDLGDVNTVAARLSMLWQPSEKFDLLLATDYTSDDDHGSPTVFGGIATTVPPASFVRLAAINAGCPGVTPTSTSIPQNTDPRCPNNQWLALGPDQTASTAPLRSKLEMFGSALTASWHPTDSVTVRSITAYRRTKPFSMRDADNTPQLILHTINEDDLKQFTQELQFLGDAIGNKLHWQTGLYYFRETDDQFYPVYLPSRIVNGAETQVGGLNSASHIENTSYAAFTQETFDITDKLNVTAGIRYTNDKKEVTPHMFPSPSVRGYTNVGYNVPNPAPLTGVVCLGPPRPGVPCTGATDTMFAQVLNEKKDDSITPMASLQYRWTPDLMTYVSYAEGFKSGGMNTRIIQPVVSPQAPTGREFLPQFDPEEVKSYELGFKASPVPALRLSGAVFRAKYDDIHIVVREGVAPVVRNAGTATIKGVELEWNLAAAGGFELSGGVGYTDFQYDSFTAQLNASQAALAPGALGRVDLDDQQAYSPEVSANLGVSYRFQTSFGGFTPRVDAAHRSKTFFDAPNTEAIAQPAYTVYNGSLRYADPDAKWSVTAGVTNFTNRRYRVSGNSSLTASSGYAEVVYAPPRQWFLQASYDF